MTTLYETNVIGLTAAIISSLGFSLLTIIWKSMRKNGAKTESCLASLIFAVPFWILIGGLIIVRTPLVISESYLGLLFLWLIVTFLFNVGYVYLFKHQPLTEISAYLLGFKILFALLLDIFIFSIVFDFTRIAIISTFFLSGILLTQNKRIKSIHIGKALSIIIGLSFFNIALYGLYKKALLLQESTLLHVALAQSLLYMIFFAVGWKKLIEDIKKGIIRVKDIIMTVVLILVACIGEAYALQTLPIVVIVISSLIPIGIFSVVDIKQKEFDISWKTAIALGLLALGVVALVFTGA